MANILLLSPTSLEELSRRLKYRAQANPQQEFQELGTDLVEISAINKQYAQLLLTLLYHTGLITSVDTTSEQDGSASTGAEPVETVGYVAVSSRIPIVYVAPDLQELINGLQLNLGITKPQLDADPPVGILTNTNQIVRWDPVLGDWVTVQLGGSGGSDGSITLGMLPGGLVYPNPSPPADAFYTTLQPSTPINQAIYSIALYLLNTESRVRQLEVNLSKLTPAKPPSLSPTTSITVLPSSPLHPLYPLRLAAEAFPNTQDVSLVPRGSVELEGYRVGSTPAHITAAFWDGVNSTLTAKRAFFINGTNFGTPTVSTVFLTPANNAGASGADNILTIAEDNPFPAIGLGQGFWSEVRARVSTGSAVNTANVVKLSLELTVAGISYLGPTRVYHVFLPSTISYNGTPNVKLTNVTTNYKTGIPFIRTGNLVYNATITGLVTQYYRNGILVTVDATDTISLASILASNIDYLPANAPFNLTNYSAPLASGYYTIAPRIRSYNQVGTEFPVNCLRYDASNNDITGTTRWLVDSLNNLAANRIPAKTGLYPSYSSADIVAFNHQTPLTAAGNRELAEINGRVLQPANTSDFDFRNIYNPDSVVDHSLLDYRNLAQDTVTGTYAGSYRWFSKTLGTFTSGTSFKYQLIDINNITIDSNKILLAGGNPLLISFILVNGSAVSVWIDGNAGYISGSPTLSSASNGFPGLSVNGTASTADGVRIIELGPNVSTFIGATIIVRVGLRQNSTSSFKDVVRVL